jgi:hypothetical protein
VLAAIAFNPWSLPAAVTTVNYWRMGENDPNVTPGTASTTREFVWNNTLTFHGGPLYDQNVSAAATAHCGSSYSVHFFGTSEYATAAALGGLQDNFGVELWVYPDDVSGSQCLVYNGDTSSGGWGIYLNDGVYSGLFGGQTSIGSGTATAQQWTHLALVRDGGATKLYVDGVPSGSTYGGAPGAVSSGSFRVAGNTSNPAGETAFGYIDEVRVFIFAPGKFSTNDLLFFAPFPNPAATTLAATAVTDTSATFNGTVNPTNYPAAAWFEYGTSAAYGQTTPVVSAGTGASNVPVAFNVSGLQSNTVYHYRLTVSNAFAVVQGSDVTFRKLQTHVVTSLADNGPGTLRDAINASLPNDTVQIDTDGTIELTNQEILITNSLSIVGLSGTNVIHKSIATDRIFEIGSEAQVLMSGLHLSGGHATNSPNLLSDAGSGGAIYNSGTLVLYECYLDANSAGDGAVTNKGGFAGGIFNAPGAMLTASNCCFAGNVAGGGGIGVSTDGSGAGGAGGAIANFGGMQLVSCTFDANSAGKGGDAPVGSTGVTGGDGGNGGAIFNDTTASFSAIACTFSGNNSGGGGFSFDGNGGNGGNGGGIYNAGGPGTLRSSIVAQNGLGAPGIALISGSSGAPGAGIDLFGTFDSSGYNLIGITDGGTLTNILTGNRVGSLGTPLDAWLGALAYNGGPTPSVLPTATNSPAFESGDDGLLSALPFDQRGFPRLSCDHVDIGAVEFRPLPVLTVLGDNPTTNLLDQVYLDAGALALIGCPGGGASLPVTTTYSMDANFLGIDTVTYTTSDPYGISLTNTRTVYIVSLPVVSPTPAFVDSTNAPQGSLNVTLNGTYNNGFLGGSAWFTWGLTLNNSTNPAGWTSFSAGTDDQSTSVTISNLVPGVPYHWQLIASNQLGIVTSSDQIFSSPPIYPTGDTDGDGVVSPAEFNAVYSNYLANAQGLLMTNVSGLGSDEVSFELSNLPPITVESSTDLVNWSALGPATPGYHFSDTNEPGAPQRFYRLRYP